MRTLVVRLDHLGDLLLTTPLIRALALADHSVDVLAREAFISLLENSPFIKESFSIESIAPNFPEKWWGLARWMRRRHYDAIILPYAKEKRLCFASAFSGARRRIAMWSGIWGRLTFHQCLRSEMLTRPRHFSKILLQCAAAIGCPEQGLKPDLFLTEGERIEAQLLIPESFRGRKIIGIHPGCAGNTCNLPSTVYGEVARLLLEQTDCAIIITGTRDEQRLILEWPSNINRSERVWLCLGELKLRQLAGVIEQMDLYLCPSTGPLHMASALGIPTVSPFCRAPQLSAQVWGNLGAPARVIEPGFCPILAGGSGCCDFRGQITADQIFEEIIGFLGSLTLGIGNAAE